MQVAANRNWGQCLCVLLALFISRNVCNASTSVASVMSLACIACVWMETRLNVDTDVADWCITHHNCHCWNDMKKVQTLNKMFHALALSASARANNSSISYPTVSLWDRTRLRTDIEYHECCAVSSSSSSLPWRLASAAEAFTTTLWRHTGHVPAYNNTVSTHTHTL